VVRKGGCLFKRVFWTGNGAPGGRSIRHRRIKKKQRGGNLLHGSSLLAWKTKRSTLMKEKGSDEKKTQIKFKDSSSGGPGEKCRGKVAKGEKGILSGRTP